GKTVNYKSKRNSKGWNHDQRIHNDRGGLCSGGRKGTRHAHTDCIDQVGHAENVNGIGEWSSEGRLPPKRDDGNYCEQPRERVADTGWQCKEAGKKAVIPERQENNSAVYAGHLIRDQPPERGRIDGSSYCLGARQESQCGSNENVHRHKNDSDLQYSRSARLRYKSSLQGKRPNDGKPQDQCGRDHTPSHQTLPGAEVGARQGMPQGKKNYRHQQRSDGGSVDASQPERFRQLRIHDSRHSRKPVARPATCRLTFAWLMRQKVFVCS